MIELTKPSGHRVGQLVQFGEPVEAPLRPAPSRVELIKNALVQVGPAQFSPARRTGWHRSVQPRASHRLASLRLAPQKTKSSVCQIHPPSKGYREACGVQSAMQES
jgi:hypothetical protein